MDHFDFIVLGGGIVGIATALQLQKQYPDAALLLVEKEKAFAQHQTGHNSGVIHAGVYYPPGSLKADFCKRGHKATIDFCWQHHLPMIQCGKLLVATDPVELERMVDLEDRCRQNGLETHRWSRQMLEKNEPHITGLGALRVPATGITDYRRISSTMAALFKSAGGAIRLGHAVTGIRESESQIRLDVGDKERLHTRYLIACGGLMADRIARMMHIDIDFAIIPFRGEYFQLPAHYNGMVKHLIYPIPDPDLPFLGVHLTRMIDGSVTVGPNAVLGWHREGYGRFNINQKDTLEMLAFPGFWKVIGKNWRSGLQELRDAHWKPGYLERLRKYCPQLKTIDLRPYPAGIRAQAVKSDGSLVHDFLFAETPRSLHVCNAPSPAATSAMPIAAYLADKIRTKFKL